MKNWVLPREYPPLFILTLKPINKALKRHTTLFPTMQTGYYPTNTHLYLSLPFKAYNLQNDGSILVQTPLSFNRKK